MAYQKFLPLALAALSIGMASPATAQTSSADQENCRAFAHFGGIVAAYILPLSVKDFADLNAGKNQRLIDGAIAKIERELTTRDKSALTRLGNENSALFEEAASDFAMNAVLAGIGGTRQEIVNTMYQECTATGTEAILQFQRAAIQEQQQQQGQ